MTNQREAFEKWWDSPTYAVNNDYREDSPIYWADIGWQAAQADQADEIKELKLKLEQFKALTDDKQTEILRLTEISAGVIAQLQLDKDKLREAEDAAWNNFEAIQPIENWLIEHGLLMVIHEGDGKSAGLNILESVKAIHAKNQITSQPESQPESTVRVFRPARDDWEGFESHWESKIPVVLNNQTTQKHTCRYSRSMQSHPRKCLDCNEAETHGIGE
jgi:hypothetical protein